MTTKIPRTLLNGWRVLVIDDEPDNADVAKRLLTHFGASVQYAENGQQGLDSIPKFKPTLILCDISMPVLDGWGVIAQIKRDRAFMEIPVVALTAHAMVGDRDKAIASGFHNYLTKPLTPSTFISDLLTVLIDLPRFADMAEILE